MPLEAVEQNGTPEFFERAIVVDVYVEAEAVERALALVSVDGLDAGPMYAPDLAAAGLDCFGLVYEADISYRDVSRIIARDPGLFDVQHQRIYPSVLAEMIAHGLGPDVLQQASDLGVLLSALPSGGVHELTQP